MSFGGFPLGTSGYSPSPPSGSRTRSRHHPHPHPNLNLNPNATTNDHRLSSLFKPSLPSSTQNLTASRGNGQNQNGAHVFGSSSPSMFPIDTSGLEDIVLPVTRSRRRSFAAGEGSTNVVADEKGIGSSDEGRRLTTANPNTNGMGPGPRRRPSTSSSSEPNTAVVKLGLGISRITEREDEEGDEGYHGNDVPGGAGLAAPRSRVRGTDVFEEFKMERRDRRGVDPSILPKIHHLLSSTLSAHRLRIQTLQSTIQHRVEEFDTVRYRMMTFDREAEGMWRGMMGDEEGRGEGEMEGIENGGEGGGVEGDATQEMEDGKGKEAIPAIDRPERDEPGVGQTDPGGPILSPPPSSSSLRQLPNKPHRLDITHRSQPHRPSPLSLSTRPASSETFLVETVSTNLPSTQSHAPAPQTQTQTQHAPHPPPLKSLLATLSATSTHLTKTQVELDARAETLENVRRAIERLPEVEAELKDRIEVKKREFEVINERKKRNERNIMIAWIVGMTSLIIAIIAWVLRCEKMP